MRKIELKYRKFLRTLFGCVSLTAVAFVFQACYGTGPAPSYSVKLTGTVKSKTTNLPIKGIKISVNHRGNNSLYNCGFTDENGKFEFYANVPNEYFYDYEFDIDSTRNYRYTYDSVYVRFSDIDSVENGLFEDKTIITAPAHKNEVKISVELEEKP